MKYHLIAKMLIIIPVFSFAQHSEKYLQLMGHLQPIDSSKIETHFKNGRPKYSGTTTYYEYGDKEYAYLTGKHVKYYRNGSRTEGIYDSMGTILENKYFDADGNLLSESKTLLLDTNAKSFQEFEDNTNHITFVLRTKSYKFTLELKKWYLFEEGEYTNGKRSGIWKYYFPNGELKTKKEY